MQTRAHPMGMPFVRPGTRCARPGAGDGGRGEREGDGTAQAPPPACVVSTSLVGSSLPPSTSRVTGFVCHSGCSLLIAQSADMQSVLFFGPRPGIPSARSIHSAELRRITYRGIVRSAAGAHYGLTRSAARERTSPAASRHLNGNSSGATAPINNAPRPRPAPSFLAPSFPPRSVRDCFVFRVPSPGAPRVLSLRSFTGELPPAAQPARWPRASSPRRFAGGSARTATRQPQRRLRRRALCLHPGRAPSTRGSSALRRATQRLANVVRRGDSSCAL
jgi:hypothetical protein